MNIKLINTRTRAQKRTYTHETYRHVFKWYNNNAFSGLP